MQNQSQILNALSELNQYFKKSGLEGQILYRTEGSHLVRAGANQISLNSYEENEKFYFTLQKGKKITQFNLSLSVDRLSEIKQAIDRVAQTLSLLPELPFLRPWHKTEETLNSIEHLKDFSQKDSTLTDPLDSKPMVDFFKTIYDNYKNLKIETSGMFSAGHYAYALINTNSQTPLFFSGDDYHLEAVLQLLDQDKKEVKVTDVGQTLKDFNPDHIHQELLEHIELKSSAPSIDYNGKDHDLIFGKDALAAIIEFMCYMSFRGELYQENKGMLRKETHPLEGQIFGDNITITDDITSGDSLYQRPFGLNGMFRPPINLVDKGVLKNLYYTDKITCNRLGVNLFSDDRLASFCLKTGAGPSSFNALLEATSRPALYINNIHYMNFTNLNRGDFTATARFGAYLLKDGKVVGNPGRVRLNLSLFEILNKVEWLSNLGVHVNTSSSYDVRLASSIKVPKFMKVKLST